MKKFMVTGTLAAVLLGGCTGNKGDNGHDHGPAPASYTLYSDKTELFVEFKPLVVGSISKFAAHFTVLGDRFLPMGEGSVTVSLIVNGKGIKQRADAPDVPGIFRLALKPVTAGSGQLVFDIAAKTYTDRIAIHNVKVYADEESALADQPEKTGGVAVTYLKEQAWKVEFANAPAKRKPFSQVIRTSGQILSAPGDEALVVANASGVVLFSGNKTIVGAEVKAGTDLFVIAGGGLAEGSVDSKFKEAKVNYDRAKSDYERLLELAKDKIVSQREVLQARADFENAATVFGAISKNYTAKGVVVPAGMNGFVKSIMISEGRFVEAGTPLAAVSKNRKLILQANVSQKYFGELNSVRSATFRTTESEKFINTEDVGGKLVSYGRSASAESPFLTVTFEMNNTGNIIPGSVVEVYLKSAHFPDALIIPVTSLIEEQGNFFVYVQTAGESFEKREIKTGVSDGIYVQVLSGVAEDERVVTKGAYQIKLSQASGALPEHGHEH